MSQAVSNASPLKGFLVGFCFSGFCLVSMCLFCTVPSIISNTKPAPTLPSVSTPLVKVGSFPIKDVDSYAIPGLVLWDLSHSAYEFGDVWHGTFQDEEVRKYLETKGYTFDLNNVGVLNLDISSYSLIVLEIACCATKSAYTSDEADVLFQYVNSGGSLFILGENESLEYIHNLDAVAEKFGIELTNGDKRVGSYDYGDGQVDRFANHPINNGVNSLKFIGVGTLVVSPPASAVAWDGVPTPRPPETPVGRYDEFIVVAVAEVGNGKVVAVSDSNFITAEYLGENELRFVSNVFDWLSQ